MASLPHDADTFQSARDLPFKAIGAMAASCFVGALFLDVVYWEDPSFMWVTFSVWSITIGLILAAVATIVGAIGRWMRRGDRSPPLLWPYPVGFAAVVLVSIVNAFVHSRDAYEAVVPDGLALSILAVALLLLTPFCARAVFRHRYRKAPR